jgi:hypothetical protein
METNLLIAIKNLVEKPVTKIVSHYKSKIRVNSIGDALEFYVKDLLCDSLDVNNLPKKIKIYEKYFSYFGNQNNPPDFIIKNGDAFEVKKIEGFDSSLALNSSYPKNILSSNDIRITGNCKNCDGGNWQEKELFYVVGSAKDGIVKYLFFVHGRCYAANHEIYDKIHVPIKKEIDSVLDSLGLEKGETVELGKVRKVDPLGITELRIRGMWQIENPINVFDYVAPIHKKDKFTVVAIMLKEKYLSFSEKDRKNIEKLDKKGLEIKDAKIKSPNNPAELLDVKILSFKQ